MNKKEKKRKYRESQKKNKREIKLRIRWTTTRTLFDKELIQELI